MKIPLLTYQRVSYTGPNMPTLKNGWEGFVSDATDHEAQRWGDVVVEFPNRSPRRQTVRPSHLEPISGFRVEQATR